MQPAKLEEGTIAKESTFSELGAKGNVSCFGYFEYKDTEGYDFFEFFKRMTEQLMWIKEEGYELRDESFRIIEKNSDNFGLDRPTIGWKGYFEK